MSVTAIMGRMSAVSGLQAEQNIHTALRIERAGAAMMMEEREKGIMGRREMWWTI